MELDQQQQKGLFTFYREQADLQDEIRSKKKRLKESKLEDISEILKSSSSNVHKGKGGLNVKKQHSSAAPDEGKQMKEKASKEGKRDGSESKDKLISILRKYNAKQMRRRDHLRVIMEMQEEPSLDQTESLKNRLEKLLADQTSHYSQLQADKTFQQQSKKHEQLLKKREEFLRLNPFQRLAIIPTNFTAELDQEISMRMPLKKVPSPPKSLVYSLEVRKNDKVEVNMTSKVRYDTRLKQTNHPLRLNLPRIEARSNSQVINKSKIMPIRLGEKHYIEPISSQRFRNKSNLSSYLEHMNEKEPPIFKPKNHIHSLFIEIKEDEEGKGKGKGKGEESGGDKEMRLGDVLMRMKFQ